MEFWLGKWVGLGTGLVLMLNGKRVALFWGKNPSLHFVTPAQIVQEMG
jgi:hypothetical protein